MTTLYVFSTEDNTLVARIEGETNEACENCASNNYGDTDTFGWTYSPAFGFAGGLLPGENVQDIEAE